VRLQTVLKKAGIFVPNSLVVQRNVRSLVLRFDHQLRGE
jgi:hypothetical protein